MTKHLVVSDDLFEAVGDALEQVRAKLQVQIDTKSDKTETAQHVEALLNDLEVLQKNVADLRNAVATERNDHDDLRNALGETGEMLAERMESGLNSVRSGIEASAKEWSEKHDGLAGQYYEHVKGIKSLTESLFADIDGLRADIDERDGAINAKIADSAKDILGRIKQLGEALERQGSESSVAIKAEIDSIRKYNDERRAIVTDAISQLEMLCEQVRTETKKTLDDRDLTASERLEGLRQDIASLFDNVKNHQTALDELTALESETGTNLQQKIAELRTDFEETLGDLATKAEADMKLAEIVDEVAAKLEDLHKAIEDGIPTAVKNVFKEGREREMRDNSAIREHLEQALVDFEEDSKILRARIDKAVAALEARPPAKDGAPGPKGERGERGEKGDRGADGIEGARGLHGEPGPQGERGEKGEPGERGPRGADGLSVEYMDIWQGGFVYHRGNLCSKNGSLWIALRKNVDEPPDQMPAKADNPAWRLTAMRGERGPKGDRGPQGPQGTPGEKGPVGPAAPRVVEMRLAKHDFIVIDEYERETRSDATEFIMAIRDAVLAELQRRGDIE